MIITAHLTALLEPLMFAPAVLVVGWALLHSRSGATTPFKEHHD